MIQKFAAVTRLQAVQALILTACLAGTTALAQQDPAAAPAAPTSQQPPAQAQQPGDQQSSSSQESTEEIGIRKPKPKEYKNWQFNVGAGGSLTGGSTQQFIRSGGGSFTAGVARNGSKYLGLRLDFQYNMLPIRPLALQSAGSTGGHAQVYSASLGPIINLPVTKTWGAYIIAAPGFFHRTGKLDNSSAIPGYACNPFFTWWGHCFNGNLPIYGQFLRASQNEAAVEFGGGITYHLRPNLEIYAEYRFLHGSHGGITTDLRPITAGIRF